MNDTSQKQVRNRPNILLIGSQKSGTTSLANGLGAHRNIFLPNEKELNFFTRPKWAEEQDAYYKRFKSNAHTQYWMDATPGYMWTYTKYGRQLGDRSPMQHNIPAAIHQALGSDVKIIAIMRHPVRRAVSAFFHQFRMGRLGSGDRIRNMGHRQGIVDLGFYSEQLAAYREYFPEDAIKTYFFEIYMAHTEEVHRDLFLWLGLCPTDVKKTMPETNAGMKLDYSGGGISVRSGMEQIRKLALHPDYKKMRVIEPPIVEQADLDFLNEIYADELEVMAQEYEITQEIWPRRLTVENYNIRPKETARFKSKSSDLKKTIRILGQAHKSGLTELEEVTMLLHNQEARHTTLLALHKRQLADSQQEVTMLKKQLSAGNSGNVTSDEVPQ